MGIEPTNHLLVVGRSMIPEVREDGVDHNRRLQEKTFGCRVGARRELDMACFIGSKDGLCASGCGRLGVASFALVPLLLDPLPFSPTEAGERVCVLHREFGGKLVVALVPAVGVVLGVSILVGGLVDDDGRTRFRSS